MTMNPKGITRQEQNRSKRVIKKKGKVKEQNHNTTLLYSRSEEHTYSIYHSISTTKGQQKDVIAREDQPRDHNC